MVFQPIGKVYFALCKSIDTPVSLGCWLRFKHNQQALAEMKISPRDYLSHDAFSQDYACVSFLSKYKGLTTGIDTKRAALEAFTHFEEKCHSTNNLFRDPQLRGLSPRVSEILHYAQRKIAAVLGPVNVGAIFSMCRWGPGATATLPRRRRYLDYKICEAPMSITSRALPYMKAMIEADYHWMEVLSGVFPSGPYSVLDSCFRVIPGDVLMVVDKNAKTGRTIGKAPTANSFLQQGPGRYIRSRLKRHGIDLDDQSINQTWASLAYDLDLCTLDLKGASDTIAKELVYSLLPPDWVQLLADLRSPFVKVNGDWLYVEKFSAMGTAFTFELETLIFWSVVQAVTDRDDPGGVVSIYGDDIICTRRVSSQVIEVLESIGFVVNHDKSFTEGNFYESCGKHYWQGRDVTPAYQKDEVDACDILVCIACHNRLYRLGTRSANSRLVLSADSACGALRRLSPGIERYRIPSDSEGDDGILTPVLELVGAYGHIICENHGIECRVLSEVLDTRSGNHKALLAHALRAFALDDLRPSSVLSKTEGFDLGRTKVQKRDRRFKTSYRWCNPPSVLGMTE